MNERIIYLRKEWKKIEKDYFKVVKRFKHKRLLSNYKFHVSNFGPEGQYRRPNLLFVRLRIKKDEKRAIETIGHEILHLLFADFFESKKLSYAEREGMVDSLILETDLVKLFPKYERQTIGKVRPVLFKLIIHS
ncbi:hypothetical protein HYZ76_02035 [Candidatus Falkowbacteria bacterium]|nr:hypothetical protein [Candidatus Falkowbacteria bacterium]